MSKVLIKSAKIILPILFWLLVWQTAAVIINRSFFLPTVPDTFKALIEVITSASFFKVVLSTLARVIAGLVIGILCGVILAVLSHSFEAVKIVVSPIISVIRATPVATFIIILWILLSGDVLAIFVAFLMVMPIIWQNLMDGYASINRELSEVCDVFEFSFAKRMRILILPALMKYFIPGVITAAGLAWKSEIAAEIIAYTKNSIGQKINDAKYFFNTPTVFAWTLVVIVMSIGLEKLTKHLLGRYKQ